MSYLTTAFDLFWHLPVLSFLAIDGASSTLPDMYRFLVDTWHYVTDERLSTMYTISQVTPSPNVFSVELLGRQAAGLDGAIVSLVSIRGPSCVIAAVITRVIDRKLGACQIALIRCSLAPLTIGPLFSTGRMLTRSANSSFSTTTLTVAIVLACSFTRVHPLVLVGFGVLVGGMGWAQRLDHLACKN